MLDLRVGQEDYICVTEQKFYEDEQQGLDDHGWMCAKTSTGTFARRGSVSTESGIFMLMVLYLRDFTNFVTEVMTTVVGYF